MGEIENTHEFANGGSFRMSSRHLFLTSSGLSDRMIKMFVDIIGKSPEEMRILYIPTAGFETDGAREGFALCLDELAKIGISHENILIYNLELLLSKEYKRTYSAHVVNPAMVSRLLTIEELRTFDAVFVSGGESTVLCREMVRTGFDDVLKRAINDGLVYVGVSAGSMYAAGNLENGLHIILNPIIPHWNGQIATEITNSSTEIQLADGQAVYVEDDEVRLL